MNHQGVTQKPMNSIKIIQTQQPNISPSFKLNIQFWGKYRRRLSQKSGHPTLH